MNYNFVTTKQIFKIQNSAESYCLVESKFSVPKYQNAPPLHTTTILFTCDTVDPSNIGKGMTNTQTLLLMSVPVWGLS